MILKKLTKLLSIFTLIPEGKYAFSFIFFKLIQNPMFSQQNPSCLSIDTVCCLLTTVLVQKWCSSGFRGYYQPCLVAIWAAVQLRPPDVDQLVILNSYALTLNGRTPATKATTKGSSLTALPLPSASSVTSWHHLGKRSQRCRAMTRLPDSLWEGGGWRGTAAGGE